MRGNSSPRCCCTFFRNVIVVTGTLLVAFLMWYSGFEAGKQQNSHVPGIKGEMDYRIVSAMLAALALTAAVVVWRLFKCCKPEDTLPITRPRNSYQELRDRRGLSARELGQQRREERARLRSGPASI